MRDVGLDGDVVSFVGALEVERKDPGVSVRRLPAWTRPQIPDLFMDVIVQMPAGVRLRFTTDSTTIELDILQTMLRVAPNPLVASTFDLLVDGELAGQVRSEVGHVISLDLRRPEDLTFDLGEPTTIRFEGLAPGRKVVELWLAQRATLDLLGLRVDDDATVEPAPPDDRRRWVHYGSSISHCLEADSPTTTWPAVAARLGGVHLQNLGLAGQCQLDPFVARTIRDLPADVISLKVGINLVNGDTMRDRTFGPTLHGFLDTIREGHPDTPILLVSPIFCPSTEDRPGPTVPDHDGRFVAVPGLEQLRLTCLTLTKIRSTIESIVAARREQDPNLHHLDGLQLFGPDDAGDLPDDLHPNAEGYVRMGERFAAHAFAPGGPLA